MKLAAKILAAILLTIGLLCAAPVIGLVFVPHMAGVIVVLSGFSVVFNAMGFAALGRAL
jgi:hypothetical protein